MVFKTYHKPSHKAILSAMFQKTSAFLFLLVSCIFTFFLIVFLPVAKFDYDFENFFSQNDQELDFYQNVFEKEFGSDNDYLLIGIQNKTGDWWEPYFLNQLKIIKNEIHNLEGVDSLISIFDLKIPKITPFGLQTFPALEWENPQQLERSKIQLNQFYGTLLAKDKGSLLFLIRNNPSLTKDQGDRLYGEILSVFSRFELKPVAVAGKIQTQRDFVNLMQEEFKWFIAASLILMLLVLWLVFQRFWGVGIPLIVLVVGLIWAFSAILFAGKSLDVMSVMQPTIFLIVGLSALVHYFSALIGKLKRGWDKAHAIQETFQEVTFSVALAVITTSIGFLSLNATSIPALKEFGLWTGIGILVVYCAILTITPGLLYLVPFSIKAKDERGNWDKLLTFLFLNIIRHRKYLLLFFVGFSLIGSGLAFQLRVDGYLLDNLPQDHPIQQHFRFFDTNYGGSNPLELYVKAGPKANNLLDFEVLMAFQSIEKKLQLLFGEGEYLSPLTLVKTMNQAQNQGNVKAFALPSQGQYNRMRPYLDQVVNQFGKGVLTEDLKFGRVSGRTADVGSFRMEELRSEFNQFVREKIDPELLEVNWTGTAFLIDKSHRSVTSQMAKGLGGAFLLIALIAGVLFKSLRMALIVLIPNLIPLIWMCGVMWILGIEFKLTTAILFTVAFGIAVDDTIHFISKFKMELLKGRSVHYAVKRTFLEAGKAIVLTSMILISGFGLLVFSDFGVTYFTGLLISVCLVFALMADLVLLPILLFPLKKNYDYPLLYK